VSRVAPSPCVRIHDPHIPHCHENYRQLIVHISTIEYHVRVIKAKLTNTALGKATIIGVQFIEYNESFWMKFALSVSVLLVAILSLCVLMTIYYLIKRR